MNTQPEPHKGELATPVTKLNDDIIYNFFKSLEADPNLSQRALSKTFGISLGKVNYCLKALIAKGWIKVRNFEKSPNKAGYAYILTPAGLETKALASPPASSAIR